MTMTMLYIGSIAFNFQLHWRRGLAIIKISKKNILRGFTFYNVGHLLFNALPFGMVEKAPFFLKMV